MSKAVIMYFVGTLFCWSLLYIAGELLGWRFDQAYAVALTAVICLKGSRIFKAAKTMLTQFSVVLGCGIAFGLVVLPVVAIQGVVGVLMSYGLCTAMHFGTISKKPN